MVSFDSFYVDNIQRWELKYCSQEISGKCTEKDLLWVTRSTWAFTNVANYKTKLFKPTLQQARNSDTSNCLEVLELYYPELHR